MLSIRLINRYHRQAKAHHQFETTPYGPFRPPLAISIQTLVQCQSIRLKITWIQYLLWSTSLIPIVQIMVKTIQYVPPSISKTCKLYSKTTSNRTLAASVLMPSQMKNQTILLRLILKHAQCASSRRGAAASTLAIIIAGTTAHTATAYTLRTPMMTPYY
jgi:hypothetical protein